MIIRISYRNIDINDVHAAIEYEGKTRAKERKKDEGKNAEDKIKSPQPQYETGGYWKIRLSLFFLNHSHIVSDIGKYFKKMINSPGNASILVNGLLNWKDWWEQEKKPIVDICSV